MAIDGAIAVAVIAWRMRGRVRRRIAVMARRPLLYYAVMNVGSRSTCMRVRHGRMLKLRLQSRPARGTREVSGRPGLRAEAKKVS